MGKNRPCRFSKKLIVNLNKEILSLELKDLKKFCKNLSQNLKIGNVICLSGELGSGKTTLARYLINSIYENYNKKPPKFIKSPSFPILLTYDVGNFEIYHYDLYRIKQSNELLELNIFEELNNSITLIEWPEIVLELLNGYNHLSINLEITDENIRKIRHNVIF